MTKSCTSGRSTLSLLAIRSLLGCGEQRSDRNIVAKKPAELLAAAPRRSEIKRNGSFFLSG
jgi:hypothetical protein